MKWSKVYIVGIVIVVALLFLWYTQIGKFSKDHSVKFTNVKNHLNNNVDKNLIDLEKKYKPDENFKLEKKVKDPKNLPKEVDKPKIKKPEDKSDKSQVLKSINEDGSVKKDIDKTNTDIKKKIKTKEKEESEKNKLVKKQKVKQVVKSNIGETNDKSVISHKLKSINGVKEAEDLYYNTITVNDWKCKQSVRIGRQDDGGWDVCFDGKLKINEGNCMSYSFGVNYIWEFDDTMAQKYKCLVRTFDPSMTRENDEVTRPSGVKFYKFGLGGKDTKWDNGWTIKKMSSILKSFGDDDKIIDILKIDIEFSEWEAFESMIKDGILKNVRQLMFETHTEEVKGMKSNLSSFKRFLKVWYTLQHLGFVQWKNHWNHFGNYNSQNTGKQRTCCYEHYMVNKNLM